MTRAYSRNLGRPLSAEHIQQIIDLGREGEDHRTIAQLVGTTRTTVTRQLAKAGEYEIRHRSRDRATEDRIVNLYLFHTITIRQLQRQYHCNQRTIYRYLHERGIDYRRSHSSHSSRTKEKPCS